MNSASIDLLLTPQPLFCPGYTGFVPQFRYRQGDTYGNITHKVLIDPTVAHAPLLVLSEVNPEADPGRNRRPFQSDIDVTIKRLKDGDRKFTHYMIPGYSGFTPLTQERSGETYSTIATDGIAEMTRRMLHEKKINEELKRRLILQKGSGWPKSIEDRMLTSSDFRMPVMEVRPQHVGVVRNLKPHVPYIPEPPDSDSPYFMNVDNPQKFMIPGYGGHVPLNKIQFGATDGATSNKALIEFTNLQEQRRGAKWSPYLIYGRIPYCVTKEVKQVPIYHECCPLIPGYTGNVPGARFRVGLNFGNDTRDGKRWLRGDFRIASNSDYETK